MSRKTILIIARHGQTDWNVRNLMQGWTDIPLNEKGVWQAQALARRIHAKYEVGHVYASDLKRAAHTAREVAELFGLDVKRDPALREKNLGKAQGMTWQEFIERFPVYKDYNEEEYYTERIEGGESGIDVEDRIIKAFKRIRWEHEGETVVVVSHGGSLRFALANLFGEDFTEFMRKDRAKEREYRNQNTAIYVFEIEGTKVANTIWNDAKHIEGI